MYSLLIVDDERWVRQGLRSTIDWQAEGIEVLGEAEDGEEALKLIQHRTPDIIITDIKMPRMDGLALIETIKNQNLPSKIIIISGYSDFNTAQRALRFGASDFVLKPIEETQVLDVVRKCVSQFNREHENHHQYLRMLECIRESLPLARQRYLETLLFNESASIYNWRGLWDRLHIDLQPERLQVACVNVYDWGSSVNHPRERDLIRYALGNIAEEICRAAGSAVACPLDHRESTDLVILRSPSLLGDENGIEPCMQSLIQASESYLGIRINIGISRIYDNANLYTAYQEAAHAEAFALFYGYGKVYQAAKLEPRSLRVQEYSGPNGWEHRFVHALKLGKELAIREAIDELISHIQSNLHKYSPYQMRCGLVALVGEVEKKMEAGRAIRLAVPYCPLPEMREQMFAVVSSFQQVHHSFGNGKRVIQLAIQYVEQHFTEAITMNHVAEHLYLNSSYFSKIFHEETGETFSKYMIRLRMEKAKLLLKDSTLKIYEVADRVGYQDFRHFAKLFKEQEGITPAKYRDIGVP